MNKIRIGVFLGLFAIYTLGYAQLTIKNSIESEVMRVTQESNVGIGKPNPTAKLEVAGSYHETVSNLAATIHAHDVEIPDNLRHVCVSGTTKMPLDASGADRHAVYGTLWQKNDVPEGALSITTGILGLYSVDAGWGAPNPNAAVGVAGLVNTENEDHWTNLALNTNRIALLGYNPNDKTTDYGLYVTALKNHFSGKVGIGITNPAYELDVLGTIQGTTVTQSDERLKTNIQKLENALEKLSALEGVSYEWRDTNRGSGTHLGLIAQQVEKTVPEVVTEDSKGVKAIAYSELTGLMIEAIKELKAEVDALKNK
jgi:hypothetical protein